MQRFRDFDEPSSSRRPVPIRPPQTLDSQADETVRKANVPGSGERGRADGEAADTDSCWVNLSSPAHQRSASSGPPSGASFVSWESLLQRNKSVAQRLARHRQEPPPARRRVQNDQPLPAPQPGGGWLWGVLIGAALAAAFGLGLWLAGPAKG
jgi:hypothetical protein